MITTITILPVTTVRKSLLHLSLAARVSVDTTEKLNVVDLNRI